MCSKRSQETDAKLELLHRERYTYRPFRAKGWLQAAYLALTHEPGNLTPIVRVCELRYEVHDMFDFMSGEPGYVENVQWHVSNFAWATGLSEITGIVFGVVPPCSPCAISGCFEINHWLN